MSLRAERLPMLVVLLALVFGCYLGDASVPRDSIRFDPQYKSLDSTELGSGNSVFHEQPHNDLRKHTSVSYTRSENRDLDHRWHIAGLALISFLLTTLALGASVAIPIWRPQLLQFLASHRLRFDQRASVQARLALVVLLTVSAVGFFRTRYVRQSLLSDQLHLLAGDAWSPAVLEGIVSSIPRWRVNDFSARVPNARSNTSAAALRIEDESAWQTTIDVRVDAIRDGSSWNFEEYGTIRLVAGGRLRTLLPGDRIRCAVEWQRILPPTNPGQVDFSERAAADGLYVRARTKNTIQIEKLTSGSYMNCQRWLAWIASRSDEAFHRYVPLDQSRMASALVLGQREQAERELQEAMLATGTIHMLAISGMHIELVTMSIFAFCALVATPRRIALLVVMFLVVAYALVAGANPPVMRAAIGLVVICFGRWYGRPMEPLNILALAAVVLVLYQPNNLWDVGTQLSFLAVGVLMLIGREGIFRRGHEDPIDTLLVETSPRWIRLSRVGSRWCWQILTISLWVWLITTPLTLFHFHVFSPIASILNLVLWIPLFIALISGIVLLFASVSIALLPVVGTWLMAVVGNTLGWLAAIGLQITESTVKLSDDLPLGHVWLPSPNRFWVIAYYLIILFIVLANRGSFVRCRRLIGTTSFVWLVLVITPSFLMNSGFTSSRTFENHISSLASADRSLDHAPFAATFVDVGHGTCVIIELPDGEVWVYDAGKLGDAARSHLSIAAVLWDRGYSHIDKLFLSHADADHFSAMAGLADRFSISELCTTQQTLASNSPFLAETLEHLKRQGVLIRVVSPTTPIEVREDIAVEILQPTPYDDYGSDNANSLCMQIATSGGTILLAGDLEGRGLQAIVEKSRRKVDCLMAPHHGSLKVHPERLLDWCTPSFVVISGGPKAKNPEVNAMYAASSREVINTAIDHAVRLEWQAAGTTAAYTWHHPVWVPLKYSASDVQNAPHIAGQIAVYPLVRTPGE